jgi:hypothetical protein
MYIESIDLARQLQAGYFFTSSPKSTFIQGLLPDGSSYGYQNEYPGCQKIIVKNVHTFADLANSGGLTGSKASPLQ